MHELFGDRFGDWPFQGEPAANMPPKMSYLFPKIDLIVDCFETKIQTPKNADAARRCYSNYKKTFTIKVLVGVETDGNCCFVSNAFTGAISDIAIVRASKLLDYLQPDSYVLADRGFKLEDEARARGIFWIVPPSKNPNRGFTPEEMKRTLRIARARILVERWIGRLRKWKQIEGPLAITELPKLDKEIKIVSHLCKFLPPLIKTSLFEPAETGPVEDGITGSLTVEELDVFTVPSFLSDFSAC